MTTNEMHIAVCEWMGWKRCEHENHPTLDWLHECEKKIHALDYERELKKLVRGNPVWFATKEQRLEALCRTLFPERFNK